VLSALLLIAAHSAQAQTETVLYNFGSQSGDGTYPLAGLVFDKEGNLYGTATGGGTYGSGLVFEITSSGTEKVLYSFGNQSTDGANPYGRLVFGKKGNLYGTTYYGGAYGSGTVFELVLSGKEAGTEKVLYSFGSQSGDGTNPYGGLVSGKKGNFYGTTYYGGAYGSGTVFEIATTGKEAGTEKVLYTFGSQSGDGAKPNAGLVLDKEGNLYGTTFSGGAYGGGTAFEVTPAGTEKVLYSFGGYPEDGYYPSRGLVLDKKGNLYGTASRGGANGWGTVFEITTADTENVLYNFGSQPGDGCYPVSGLAFGKKGNLYGTTLYGGEYGLGTVFEVTP